MSGDGAELHQNPSGSYDLNPGSNPAQRPGTGLRASDAERESALRILATHFADGRLERAEFDERADAALAARTQDQLRTLFADLPGPAPVPPAVSEHALGAGSASGSFAAVRWQARPPAAPWAAPLVLVPVLLAFAVLAALHGAPPFPFIVLTFILLRRHRRSTRWNREVRPWT
jgi:hypothetical protein